ncbi:MAG: hypothetical protein J5855_01090 [Mailhella sp.]|nr:hypothetical protein [Mailhella sp.]
MKTTGMKKMSSAFAALAACAMLLPAPAAGEGLLGQALGFLSGGRTLTVGTDIKADDITDFYHTVSTSTFPPHYQRYRFCVENGEHRFFHETREGDHWPLLESDATDSGTKILDQDEWAAFFRCVEGGSVKNREEHLESGGSGPWMFLYRKGGPKEGQEFYFSSPEAEFAFLKLCAALKKDAGKR